MNRIIRFVMLFLAIVIIAGCTTDDDDDNDGDSSIDDDQTSDDDAAIDDDITDDDATDDDAADDDAIDDDHADDDTWDDDNLVFDDELAPPPSDEIGIFVAITGNDDDPGTMTQPVKNIARGVELATASDKAVFVARGTYEETVATTVSLYGGYDETDWSRDLTANLTTIQTEKKPAVVVAANTKKTIIEGFSLFGCTYDLLNTHTAGVRIMSGNSILHRNDIGNCPDQEGKQHFAVLVENGSVSIVRNTILPESSLMYFDEIPASIGVQANGGSVRLYRNLIKANYVYGPISGTYGVFGEDGSRILMVANEVQSGANMLNESIAGEFHGDATLVNNTFYSPSSAYQIGIRFYTADAAMIDNIVLSRVSLQISDSSVVFMNNLFWNDGPIRCLISVYPNECVMNDIDEFNACDWPGCSQAAGNMQQNAALIGGGDFHLTGQSPCIDAGTDPSPWYDGEAIYYDFDGDLRPAGASWDIGMDEYINVFRRDL